MTDQTIARRPAAKASGIVVGFGLLQGLLLLMAMLGGVALFVRGGAVAQGVYYVAVALALRRTGAHRSLPMAGLVLIQLMGTSLGALHVAAGGNSLIYWSSYSLLGASWVAALAAGSLTAASLPTQALVQMVLLSCAGEVALLIPRVLVTGVGVRSPWGSSVWLGAVLVLYATGQIPRKWRPWSVIVLVLGLAGTLLSGMRSSLLLGLSSIAMAIFYLIRIRRAVVADWKRLALAGFVAFAVVSVTLPWLLDAVEAQVGLATNRLNATLLNEGGVVLDEDRAGREAEAEWALDEFRRRDDSLAVLVGFGHGFTFHNWSRDERLAHVHVTPVAFFTRYGLIGVAFLISLMLLTAKGAAAAFLERPSEESHMRLALRGTMLLLWSGSLIAGVMVPASSWWLLGASLGAVRERRASP